MAATTVGFFWHPPVTPSGAFVSSLEREHRADTILVQLHQVSSLHPQHIDFLAEFGAARGAGI
jgi:hypothetical protein